MAIRDIYLKIEPIEDYSPVAPMDETIPPIEYRRDCMRNMGHADGHIPAAEVEARTLRALVYREYLDPDYLIPKVDKLISADINEPIYSRRVPGTVIYAKPPDTLRIHVLNGDNEAHSFHLHGLEYGIESDGAWPFGTEAADGRRSDEICPGDSWTYTFRIRNNMVGTWPFHDHAQRPAVAIDRGLFGAIIVLPARTKLPDALAPPHLDAFHDRLHKAHGGRRVHVKALGKRGKLLHKAFLESLEEWTIGEIFLPPKPARLIHAPIFLHHMADATAKPLFDSGDMEELIGVFEHTFGDAGDFDYFCSYHTFMTGRVEVVPGGPATVTVDIVDTPGPPGMAFSPDVVQIGVGGTVRWENLSIQHHTVTSQDGSTLPTHALNGRAFVGNTPTISARSGATIRWYVFNLDLGMNWHNFHPHSARWKFAGENIDVRSLGPAESFTMDTKVPPVIVLDAAMRRIQSPRYRPKTARLYHLKADYVFHCHVHHHMMGGMVGLVRAHQSVWLTRAMARKIAKKQGLPLDDGSNSCPEVDVKRCKRRGEGVWEEVPGTPPVTMMHSALLPESSKVLFFGYDYDLPPGGEYSWLWDETAGYQPTANQVDDITAGGYTQWSLWSSEHTFLGDAAGTLLVHGGYRSDLRKAYLFDPASRMWSITDPTADERFYSTTLTLDDGRALTIVGSGLGGGGTSHSIEVYEQGVGWGAAIALPADYHHHVYYPWTYLLPDGRLFIGGPHVPAQRFDWSALAGPENFNQVHGDRSTSSQRGTSVLLTLRPPGYAPRVLIAAGNTAATQQTSEIIDLSAGAPSWISTADMDLNEPHPEQCNSVLLPDGRVFLAGGILGADGGPAEIYDPRNPAAGWQRGPHMTHRRGYHSSMLLLADGSVLAGGDPKSGGITPHERFYPDYFTVPRPTITGAPASVGYGAPLTINTPDAAAIAEVVLLRPGAVTHGFNMSQRAIECAITGGGAASVAVQTPPDGNVAPPGWYLLFVLDGDRVPSEGRWIRLA